MSEPFAMRLSWVFVGLAALSAAMLFGGSLPVGASDDDHERAREFRHSGDIVPLSQLLARPELAGQKVLEAEIDDEHGRFVYELELLGEGGLVSKWYFDAATGEPIARPRDD